MSYRGDLCHVGSLRVWCASRSYAARIMNDTVRSEMPQARTLLHRLLDYIYEQAKEINPRAFRLTPAKGFLRRREDVAGLPGVEFDLRIAGDHVWLRIQRLQANSPPPIPEYEKGLFRVSEDPDAAAPTLDEAGLLHRIERVAAAGPLEERPAIEALERATAAEGLNAYTALWRAWAEGERPRRKTIALYGDLFSLKHQLEAEETAKAQELVWGVGLSCWQLAFEGSPATFDYPLLTQTVEISLHEGDLTLEIRPRATETRVELDAFIACQLTGAADVERAMREHLARHKDRPVTPFDPSSYSDVLKLAAGNLDSKGSYREVLAKGESAPVPGEHLVVTDAWVLLSRPRTNNYLFDDLRRLQEKLEAGCDIPSGPLALRLHVAQINEPINGPKRPAGAPPPGYIAFSKTNPRSVLESTNRCKNEPKTNLKEPRLEFH
jgi:hypothetical protein